MQNRVRTLTLITPLLVLIISLVQSDPIISEKSEQMNNTSENTTLDLKQNDGNQAAYDLLQTSDGGFALVGWTDAEGAGGRDIWLIKIDVNGNLQWNRTYGGVGNDYAMAFIQMTDGGYALAGRTNSFGSGGYDMWLVKTDAGGVPLWNQTYGGSGYDTANTLLQTTDGGFALAGGTGDVKTNCLDMWLVKADKDGNMLWNQTFIRTANDDMAYDLLHTEDGGFMLAGRKVTCYLYPRSPVIWLVKTDANGTLVWEQNYRRDSEVFALIQATDGGFVMTGVSDSYFLGNMWLGKIFANGTLWWSQTFGGSDYDYTKTLVQTTDGGYAVAGGTMSFGNGRWDMWLVKTDAEGNVQWNQTYGGRGEDYAYGLLQTSDGGYVLTGYTNSYSSDSDIWFVKTDPNGVIQWHRRYGGMVKTSDMPISIDGNADFAIQADLKGWLGDGTQVEPYIIKNLTINGYSNFLIAIRNVDAYFIITDCVISNGEYSGFYFSNVTHSQIINNTLNNNYYGLYLVSSDNNIVINNTICNSELSGMILTGTSSNNIITFNAFNETESIQEGSTQAHDYSTNGTVNKFSFNYWNEWTTPDMDGDGIVDDPYIIHGDAHNVDSYPLVLPYETHQITGVIINPNGGERLTGNVTIEWKIFDILGHNLTYSLFYSADGGIAWTLLRSGLTSSTYYWDTRTVKDGPQYLIRINASCREGKCYELTSGDTFTIDNKHHFEPFKILSPESGRTYFGLVIIRWTTGEDVFNHQVNYTIAYSNDNGMSWIYIALDLTNTSYLWDSTLAADGEQYLICVNASCREGSWYAVTSNGTFTIANTPPFGSLLTTPSVPSINPNTPVNLLPLIQVIGLGSILVFVITIIIIIRRQQLE